MPFISKNSCPFCKGNVALENEVRGEDIVSVLAQCQACGASARVPTQGLKASLLTNTPANVAALPRLLDAHNNAIEHLQQRES